MKESQYSDEEVKEIVHDVRREVERERERLAQEAQEKDTMLRLLDMVEELRAEGYEVLAVEQVEHSTKLQTFQAEKGKRYAVVLGNEVKGVHQEVVDASDGCLEIPQLGTKHSMNVSVTAGIVIYHFAREIIF